MREGRREERKRKEKKNAHDLREGEVKISTLTGLWPGAGI
jgi:hypothetical protein